MSRSLRAAFGLALVAGVMLATSASAHAPHRPAAAGVVVPHVVSAQDCDGTLWVVYGTRVVGRDGRTTDVLDDGLTGGLELMDISGRSQPNGVWLPVAAGRGGEGRLRVPEWSRQHPGSHFRFAKVVREGRSRVESGPALITVGCPG